MTIKFAATFELHKYSKNNKPKYGFTNNLIITSEPNVDNLVDVESDLVEGYLDYDSNFAKLKNNILYFIYISGNLEWDSSIDWETGIDEGGFILDIEFVNIVKLKKYNENDENNKP